MKILLLSCEDATPTQPLVSMTHYNGIPWIDFQLQTLLATGYEVGVVISKAASEPILRGSREIHNCDLIFDTNVEGEDLLSNLRAGLFSVNNDALVVQLKGVPPSVKMMQSLFTHPYRMGNYDLHLVRPAYPTRGTFEYGTSFYVTKKGNLFLCNNDDISSLDDPRILWSPLPVLDPQITRLVNSASLGHLAC